MDRYLVFGGTGSLGKKLIERLIPNNEVRVYSRDESKHWSIRNELIDDPNASNLKFIVGDIRDYDRVRHAILNEMPNVIIIAAALKQVDTCELSPSESILTNLIGTQNVVRAVQEYGMMHRLRLKVLFVSTDKACSPCNVYGMCKAISERVVTSQAMSNPALPESAITYLCTRYGNVLESRGSIVPLFKYQAENGARLTVTDPDMTRYLMTLDDSVDLIAEALAHGMSGETWVPRLAAMRVGDLADVFSERYGKPTAIVGMRPGEKMHEELINESESVRTRSVGAHYYVIAPAYVTGTHDSFTYTSADDVMSKQDLATYLDDLGIFDMRMDQFKGLSIEELAHQKKVIP